METAGCLFGHRDAHPVFAVADRLSRTCETFQIMRCRECGLLFLSPRPTLAEIIQYYPYEEYRREFAPAVEDESSWLRRWNRRYSLSKLCRFIERARTGGRLLDVGCGTGNFLAQMRKRGGWEVYGLDINWEAIEYAQRRFHLRVCSGVLEEAQYPSAFFDVVTLWNVLEHLHNPRQTLREVRRILHPDGILALSVPNGGSLDARLFGPYWIGLDPPRHLYTFTRKTLEQLLVQTGFRILQVRHVNGSYHSFVASVQLYIQNSISIPNMTVLRILCRLVSSWPIHVLIFPYLRIAERAGRGAILSVLAKSVSGHGIA
ncbi:MAG TPA: class I SAM-dependent methyltransferase [Anaerolineae bacterium]|nr:class I SAM-dependent methyltransferase [Anaerolineae bacterium]